MDAQRAEQRIRDLERQVRALVEAVKLQEANIKRLAEALRVLTK